MESEQAHAPQQAEQEAETPQDKIEAEEGGEAQNQQACALPSTVMRVPFRYAPSAFPGVPVSVRSFFPRPAAI